MLCLLAQKTTNIHKIVQRNTGEYNKQHWDESCAVAGETGAKSSHIAQIFASTF